MYQVFPRLPYGVSSILCVIYTAAFVLCNKKQQKENTNTVSRMLKLNEDVSGIATADLVRKYRRMNMVSQECLALIAGSIHDMHSMHDIHDMKEDDDKDGGNGKLEQDNRCDPDEDKKEVDRD